MNLKPLYVEMISCYLFLIPELNGIILFSLSQHISGRVAQLDRALASGAKGRGFESRLVHQ